MNGARSLAGINDDLVACLCLGTLADHVAEAGPRVVALTNLPSATHGVHCFWVERRALGEQA